MRLKIVLLVTMVAILAGCSSTIKKYDTTYTKAISERDAKGNRSGSYKSSFFEADRKNKPKPYFVEFRARGAKTYGHVAVVFGKLNDDGSMPISKKGVLNPKKVQISGLHPATTSSVPWSVGHLVPVPAETGPSDGDFEEIYVASRYQINLTKKEFNKLVRIVARHKRQYKVWHAANFMANCLGYMSSIASDMGLNTPRFAKLPKGYVEELKRVNKTKRL